jgi:hypothetical protein
LTISGLAGGQTYLGFGNGVHTVAPTFYQATPERWTEAYGADLLSIHAIPGTTTPTTGSSHVSFAMANIYFFGTAQAVFLTSTYWVAVMSHMSGVGPFPFTSGSVTTKIKNRAFGRLTTDAGVHISWQRAPNWPANP